MAEKAIDGMLAKNAADLAKEQEVSRRCFAFSQEGPTYLSLNAFMMRMTWWLTPRAEKAKQRRLTSCSWPFLLPLVPRPDTYLTSPYDILDLPVSAADADIKRQYRKKSLMKLGVNTTNLFQKVKCLERESVSPACTIGAQTILNLFQRPMRTSKGSTVRNH
jgi:hypothetical protein